MNSVGKFFNGFGRFHARKLGSRFIVSLLIVLFLYTFYKYSKRQNYEAEYDDVVELNSPTNASINKMKTYKIAIGLAISTKGFQDVKVNELTVFSSLFKSLCNTISHGYNYTIYMGYDYNDPVFSNIGNVNRFHKIFHSDILPACRKIPIAYKLVKVNYFGKPTWAQNDVMQIAYLEGNDYFYRLNDDVFLSSSGWTEKYISALQMFKPKNLGVVGPKVLVIGGNSRVLTFDFVHRTHLDIFGYYYPREFPGWFGDDWITHVYQPFNSVRLKDVLIIHKKAKIRYKTRAEAVESMDFILGRDKNKINHYVKLQSSLSNEKTPLKNAISMDVSEYNIDNFYGALRNLVLSKVYMKGCNFFLHADMRKFPKEILSTFIKLNATFVDTYKNKDVKEESTAKFLPLINPKIDYLYIRNPLNRLSKMDETFINEFLSANKSCQVLYDCSEKVGKGTKLRFLSFNVRKVRKIIPYLENLFFLDRKGFIGKLHSLLRHDCLSYYKESCKNLQKSITISNNHHFDLLDEKFDKNSIKLLA